MDESTAKPELEQFLASVPMPHGGEASTLSFEHSPLVLLAVAGNRYSREAGRLFKGRHQQSLMIWRVLGLLASKPGVTVAFATRTTGIDKAAVSRALATLEESALATTEASVSDPRRKIWWLSEAGYDLHREMLQTSLEIHQTLLHGLSDDESRELARLLSIVSANFSDIAEG